MKKIYNVSVELTGDPEELIAVRYFSYLISADCSKQAINRAFEEIYKDDDNYNRAVLTIHLNKLDVLMD